MDGLFTSLKDGVARIVSGGVGGGGEPAANSSTAAAMDVDDDGNVGVGASTSAEQLVASGSRNGSGSNTPNPAAIVSVKTTTITVSTTADGDATPVPVVQNGQAGSSTSGLASSSSSTTIAAAVAGPSRVASSSSSSRSTSTVRRAVSEPLSYNPTKQKVGYCYDARMLMHQSVGEEHPEQPERLTAIMQKIHELRLGKAMTPVQVRRVRKAEILLVHSEDHWDKVEKMQRMSFEDIANTQLYYQFLSIYVCPSTTLAAELSCGGVIDCALAVAKGELKKTFAVVRPPGHHAEPEEHMGFCFFNNVAVAARVVQESTNIRKILILDWDVHHGNGTQRAFWDDPDILYISLHRYEQGSFYPCGPFGGIDSCGEGRGLGTSVNIPWPEAHMRDSDYIHAFQRIVMPIAMEFAPELVIISAGFDAAEGDPLGECDVTPKGYAHMTHMLSSLAGGKLVVALEGGYNVDSVASCSAAVIQTMLGQEPPEMASLTVRDVAMETVWQVALQQSRYWDCLNPKACEPNREIPEIVTPIPEVLKNHRQMDLSKHYGMLSVPLIPEYQERFDSQILCSEDLMDRDTLVLFVHQFGNIRAEIATTAHCDINLEMSYLMDTTKALIKWIREKNFAYVEINTHPHSTHPSYAYRNNNAQRETSAVKLGQELVTYIWDNYIQLSNASNVVLVGQGDGCSAIMELLIARVQTTTKKVKAVVQVIGNSDLPQAPRDLHNGVDSLRKWYIRNSFVVIHNKHPTFVEGRIMKRHGTVRPFEEARSVRLMQRALPDIQMFIEAKLNAGRAEPKATGSDVVTMDILPAASAA